MELNLLSSVSLIPIRPITDADVPVQKAVSAPLPNYVSGPENRLVEVVYQSLLIHDNLCQVGFNPVVLFGPIGVGKSHLALGMADAWRQQHPTSPVCMTTARNWALSYAAALQDDRVPAWRDAQREFQLFLIEDIAQLHKRQAAQRELAMLLDDFRALAVRCFVTARANPVGMTELTTELASRLTAGLTVPIHHPGTVAREQIVHAIAQQRNHQLTENAARFLAANGGNTFIGVRQAILSCCLNYPHKRRFSISDIRKSLSAGTAAAQLPLNTISIAVARYYGVTNKQITGPSRRQAVTRARAIAIYLCRELTDASLKEIGRHFGDRDHTTVIHAYRKTEQRSRTESDVQTAIDDLTTLLRSRAQEPKNLQNLSKV